MSILRARLLDRLAPPHSISVTYAVPSKRVSDDFFPLHCCHPPLQLICRCACRWMINGSRWSWWPMMLASRRLLTICCSAGPQRSADQAEEGRDLPLSEHVRGERQLANRHTTTARDKSHATLRHPNLPADPDEIEKNFWSVRSMVVRALARLHGRCLPLTDHRPSLGHARDRPGADGAESARGRHREPGRDYRATAG